MNKLTSKVLAVTLGLLLSVIAFAGLETGTYISDLVSTNPTSSDLASQGDDHIRLVKSTIKTTFPNITGAVTPTHTELNFVDGVTSAIQTQLDAKLATSSYTAADVLSKLLTVDGSGSTLDADLLDGQSSAFYLSAANLNAGTLADARVASSNVTQHMDDGYARNISSPAKAGTTKTLSTSAASGGSDGDIWYRY